MSTYEELKGLKVKYLSSDTSGDRIQEGEVFYNSSDFNLKSFVTTAAWHSSANLLTATRGIANTGSETASVAYGGFTTTLVATTLEYNGSGWASGENMPSTQSEKTKGGTQTAVIAAGGDSGNSTTPAGVATIEYDGTDWTAGGNLGTGRYALQGDGTQTAGWVCGGNTNGPGGIVDSNKTEEYNGTAWTNGGNLNTDRNRHAAAGLQTAGLAIGGTAYPLAVSSTGSATEEYDGSSWTTGNSMNTQRYSLAGGGIQTNALVYGGSASPGRTSNTELYDGTSWAETANLAAVNNGAGGDGLGTTKAWINVGGNTDPGNTNLATTEEFTISLSATTAGAWSSGGNTGVAGQAASPVAGTLTAGSIVGRNQGPPSWYSNVTQHYDGSSWTNGGNYPTAGGYLINEGTQTAAVAAINGIFPGSPPFLTPTASNEYDGSSWTSTGSIGTARYGAAGFGTQTAAMGVCGSIVPANSIVNSESYDGSSWTAGPNAVNERQRTTGTGIQTAGLVGGGFDAGPANSYTPATNIEEFDGSSFSNSGGNTHSSWQQGCFGTASSAIFFGGNNAPPGLTTATAFDGTSSFTSPSMTVGRSGGGGGGTTTAGLAASGGSPAFTAPMVATEEWTGETTAARAVKTIDFD